MTKHQKYVKQLEADLAHQKELVQVLAEGIEQGTFSGSYSYTIGNVLKWAEAKVREEA